MGSFEVRSETAIRSGTYAAAAGDTLGSVEQSERRGRRDQSRRRTERQRRTVLSAAGAGALLFVVILGLSSLSGGAKSGGGDTEEAVPPPPELPAESEASQPGQEDTGAMWPAAARRTDLGGVPTPR